MVSVRVAYLVRSSAVCLKMRSKPSQHLFSIIDLAKWAPRITKFGFVRRIGRTNEAAGLIVLSPNSAQNTTYFNTNRLFGRVARAMTTNAILNFQNEYYRQGLIRGYIFK